MTAESAVELEERGSVGRSVGFASCKSGPAAGR